MSNENILATIVTQNGLTAEKAAVLIETFTPLVAEAGELCAASASITVTAADQVTEMKAARAARLKLRDVRIRAEHARKTLKEDALKTGRTIDAVNNWLLAKITPEEDRLDDCENFAERMEAERRARLHVERSNALQALGVDPSFYQLGPMPEDQWQQLLASTKAAIEAKKAEAKRIADEQAAEAERVRAEREALRKQQAEIAARAEQKRKELEAKLQAERKERARIEAEAAAKAEKQREENEAKLQAERAERERAEADARRIRAEQEARERAERERIAAEQEEAARAAAAPDREKLRAFASQLLELPLPSCTTSAGLAAVRDIDRAVQSLATSIMQTSDKLRANTKRTAAAAV